MSEKDQQPRPAALGPLETRVLEAVWGAGRAVTVRDVHEGMDDLAYTTIMTTIDRLYRKGMVDRDATGRAFVYSPRVSPRELQQGAAQTLVARLLEDEDMEAARPVLSCLVDTVGAADGALLDELERLVREKQREIKRRGGR